MELIHKSTVVEDIRKLIEEVYAGRPFDSLSRDEQFALWYAKSILSSIDALEVKGVDLEKEFDKYTQLITTQDIKDEPFTQLFACAQHFYKLGLKAQKGE